MNVVGKNESFSSRCGQPNIVTRCSAQGEGLIALGRVEMRFRELANATMNAYPGLEIDIDGQLAYYKSIAERVTAMTTDTIEYTNDAFDSGKKILIEQMTSLLYWYFLAHI